MSMKTNNIKSKIMTGVILASMMIGASTGAFAADSSSTTSSTGRTKVQYQGRNNGFRTKLDALVTAGKITSDQETAIKAALTPQGEFKVGNKGGEHKDFLKNKLAELVTAGTLTSDEQTAIETALSSANGNFKTALDSLVTAGTITSEKETAIVTALKPQVGFSGGEHKDFLKNKLAELVTAGTIISDEQTAIETALSSANGNFKTALDSLVTAGTITSEKESAIEAALKPKADDKDDTQKATERKDMLKSKLDALVTAGTITSDQETAVLAALTPSK